MIEDRNHSDKIADRYFFLEFKRFGKRGQMAELGGNSDHYFDTSRIFWLLLQLIRYPQYLRTLLQPCDLGIPENCIRGRWAMNT
jgi:hypothetical protein